MRLLNVLLCIIRIAAALRPISVASSRDASAAVLSTTPPAARFHAVAGASAAAALTPAAAFAAATTEAELDDYFAEPHPEFAVGLVIHWILWGKFDRRVALAYDFGGLVLFAAEPFFR